MNTLALLLLGVLSSGRPVDSELHTFLRDRIGFSQSDLQGLEQGEVLTRLLDSDGNTEIAVFGVMHLRLPPETFVEQYRDIETFISAGQVESFGKFDTPPLLENLDGLTLEPSEIEDIKECEVGSCKMKLPASVIERLQKEVDWSKSDYQDRAEELIRQTLVDYVQAYLIGGNTAMGQYDDQKNPLRLADEFHELLLESHYLYEYVPELHSYLEFYPNCDLPNSEDFIYWSERKYDRLRPIVSLNHVTIVSRPRGKIKTMIASKQIYANHYFEASLELTALIDDEVVGDSSGFYLLYLNRSRFDTLRKSGPPGMRERIRGGVLEKMGETMKSTKAQMVDRLQGEVKRANEGE